MLHVAKPLPARELEEQREKLGVQKSPFSGRWLAIAAAVAVAFGGAYAGLPQSASALGGTYDVAELAKLKVIGVEPDEGRPTMV